MHTDNSSVHDQGESFQPAAVDEVHYQPNGRIPFNVDVEPAYKQPGAVDAPEPAVFVATAAAEPDLKTKKMMNGDAGHASSANHSREDDQDEESLHAINPLGLHLVTQAGKGRGVFTTKMIAGGTLLEESPVLLMSQKEWEEGRLNDTILGEYGFCWSNGGMALGLGLASLFNHSPKPNVNFIRQTASSTIKFITSRRVAAGEELCICYSADESKLWFTPSGSHLHQREDDPTHHHLLNGSVSPDGHRDEVPTSSDEDDPIFPKLDRIDLHSEPEMDGEESADKMERVKQREARRAETRAEERSTKDVRRQKYFAKHKSYSKSQSPPPAGTSIAQPTPIRPGEGASILDASSSGSGGSSASGTDTPVSFDYPEYPDVPEGVISRNLPEPLHSRTGRRKNSEEAVLVADIDWKEEDWIGPMADEEELENWDGAIRIKGPTEQNEDDQDSGTVDIWAVHVLEPKLTGKILCFIKDLGVADPRLRHLKRVAKRPNDGKYRTSIALCSAEDNTYEGLKTLLNDFSPLLGVLEPVVITVPGGPARTLVQLRQEVNWPVVYSPLPPREDDCSAWSTAKKSWVQAGINRILQDALISKQKGELPVAVFCSSPPSAFWPNTDSFVPPTPFLRAAAHDTRKAENHPLRHAAFNCIAHIANLRTRPPFSEMMPTRNGADYLLTSLSLFITHEPCVMCCMALLHSRVREVFYIFPNKAGGGFESAFGVHGRRDLNHRYDVWKYQGPIPEDVVQQLKIEEAVAL